MNLKTIFQDKRIVALAGEKNSGKSNNIVSLVVDFRKENTETAIYCYGFNPAVADMLKNYNVISVDSLEQLIEKRDCILLLDEFQKLNLNDHRYRKALNEFVDFVYHNNIFVLLSSPNIREFNSIIGSKIERWCLKTVYLANCINGSQLKKAILDYKGKFKTLNSIVVPADTIVIINNEKEMVVKCKYVQEADTKQKLKDLFGQNPHRNPQQEKTQRKNAGTF